MCEDKQNVSGEVIGVNTGLMLGCVVLLVFLGVITLIVLPANEPQWRPADAELASTAAKKEQAERVSPREIVRDSEPETMDTVGTETAPTAEPTSTEEEVKRDDRAAFDNESALIETETLVPVEPASSAKEEADDSATVNNETGLTETDTPAPVAPSTEAKEEVEDDSSAISDDTITIKETETPAPVQAASVEKEHAKIDDTAAGAIKEDETSAAKAVESSSNKPEQTTTEVAQQTKAIAPALTESKEATALDSTAIAKIKWHLAEAEKDIAELKLTIPAEDSAYQHYKEILQLDPGNSDAIKGKHRIVKSYAGLFARAMNAGNRQEAGVFLQRAVTVMPEALEVETMRKQLSE